MGEGERGEGRGERKEERGKRKEERGKRKEEREKRKEKREKRKEKREKRKEKRGMWKEDKEEGKERRGRKLQQQQGKTERKKKGEKKKKKRKEKLTSLLAVSRVRHKTTQSKVTIPRDRKVRNSQLIQHIHSISLRLVGNLSQTEVNVESQVEEDTVSGALDVVVTEHDVGLEEVDGFVDDIGAVFCFVGEGDWGGWYEKMEER